MAGVPVVFSSEHNWVPGRTTYEAVLGAMNAFCTDRIVGVAEAVSTQLKGWCGIPRNKVVTVANAIEMDGFADGFDEAEKRRELGIPFDCSIIGNIARLTGQKAQRYFIDSAAIILERNAKCEFLIVGEGELRAELEEYTRTLGVTEHVRFLGFRDDVREIMRLLDVLCLSSIHEGTPITLLEGMACEKPVVSTDVGGCREVVVDGETGFLVQPRDPQALAEALLRLVDDKDLAVRMGQAGLRRVREVYSEDANLSVLNNLYQAVMTEKHLVTEPK
jgi:glycosyltransferase involved in cell wall biosynthesis